MSKSNTPQTGEPDYYTPDTCPIKGCTVGISHHHGSFTPAPTKGDIPTPDLVNLAPNKDTICKTCGEMSNKPHTFYDGEKVIFNHTAAKPTDESTELEKIIDDMGDYEGLYANELRERILAWRDTAIQEARLDEVVWYSNHVGMLHEPWHEYEAKRKAQLKGDSNAK